MEVPPLTSSQRAAIASLLDDPSPAVRAALIKRLQACADAARDFLREIADGPNRLAGLHARWYLLELDFADPVSEFRGFIRSLCYELETGVFLLARTVYPDLDISVFCRTLDGIATRCRELMIDSSSPRERCKVINRVLFHEMELRGNAEDYTNPENSFVHRVLETRKGLPITLAILYLLVANRCGLELEPVGLPGHFLVGCYRDGPAFFIDAFDRGRFLSGADVVAQLEARSVPFSETYLAPTPLREVLARCCRNLAHHFATTGNLPRARLFAGFAAEFESVCEENSRS